MIPCNRTVVWRVTNACSLSCDFCGFSRDLKLAPKSADPREVLRAGHLFAQRPGHTTLISLLGGEPLLWPHWEYVVHALSGLTGLRLSLTTNGALLNEARTLGAICDTLDEIVISVDGLPPVHDRLRKMPGLFDTIATGIQRIRAERKRMATPRITVNTLLMHDTLHGFPGLITALAELGVERLTFNALGGRDRPEFFPSHALTVEDLSWLGQNLEGWRARAATHGLQICGSLRYVARMAAFTRGEAWCGQGCSQGREFLFVDEDGWIMPCCFTSTAHGIPLAEIQTLADLQALPGRFAAQPPAAVCADCPSTQVFGKFVYPPATAGRG